VDDVTKLDDALKRAAASGEYRVEYRIVRPTAAVVWVADRGRVIHEEGGRKRIVGVSVDLTALRATEQALRESEARLSTILQNTPALVYLMDSDSRFVHVNRRVEQLVGKRNEELRGRSVYEILPHDTAVAFDTNNRRVLSGRDSIEFEEWISESDGEHVYSSIKAPLFDASDTPDGIVAVSTDITERKRLEDALREADRRKDEFLATLAHELRNPLAPVRYALQVIALKGPNTPQVNWAIDLIERQTKSMSRLIDDLLDVSRITRNALRLRRERIELSEVISNAIETSRPLIESSGQELIVSLPPQAVYLDVMSSGWLRCFPTC
jgi:PAS domain S-box-containing protein